MARIIDQDVLTGAWPQRTRASWTKWVQLWPPWCLWLWSLDKDLEASERGQKGGGPYLQLCDTWQGKTQCKYLYRYTFGFYLLCIIYNICQTWGCKFLRKMIICSTLIKFLLSLIHVLFFCFRKLYMVPMLWYLRELCPLWTKIY